MTARQDYIAAGITVDETGLIPVSYTHLDVYKRQVLIFLWEKDGVTQQELCNATFKDKPSMTRLIDNMERQHLVVRISDKKDRRTNLIHLTKDGKELEERARVIANQTLKEALQGITIEELSVSQEVLRKIFFNTKD